MSRELEELRNKLDNIVKGKPKEDGSEATPIVEQTPEPITAPVAQPVPEIQPPVAQPIQPVVQPIVQPVVQHVQQPVAQPVAQPVQPQQQYIPQPVYQQPPIPQPPLPPVQEEHANEEAVENEIALLHNNGIYRRVLVLELKRIGESLENLEKMFGNK